MSSLSRIALNTFYMYIQLIISMIMGLFTTRILLADLGEVRYGIFVIVAGVVTLIGIANGTLTLSTIRFLGYAIGKKDDLEVKRTFNSSLFLHVCIGVTVFLIMEIIGPYLINNVLTIPIDYNYDATFLFHLIAISGLITVVGIPFDAVIRSYEQFSWLSLINIFNSSLNLIFVLILQIFAIHKLIYYGFFLMILNLIIVLVKFIFVYLKFPSCRIKISRITKSIVQRILGFSVWNSFTLASSMVIVQSKDIFLNTFFGVRMNAANGISSTLTSNLNSFSANISAAATPQIMQNFGSGNMHGLKNLASISERFTALLYAFFSIPVFFEIPYLLEIWLGSYPEISVVFIRLIIINMMIEKFTFQLEIAIKSTGNIRKFTLFGFLVILQTLPITYLILSSDPQPYYVFLVSIFIALLTAYVRLSFAQIQLGIGKWDYLKSILIKVIPVVTLSSIITLIPFLFLNQGLFRLIIVFSISSLGMIVFGYLYGLNKNEKQRLNTVLNSYKSKLM